MTASCSFALCAHNDVIEYLKTIIIINDIFFECVQIKLYVRKASVRIVTHNREPHLLNVRKASESENHFYDLSS